MKRPTPPADTRSALGLQGEQAAERFLRGLGYRVLARRYDTPMGELDLVMQSGRTIVFVEVKTRADRRLADPQDAVRSAKLDRMRRAATIFLRATHRENVPARFDVVAVVMPPPGGSKSADSPQIEHFQDV
ncbi:MAG: YraN family protein [Phycisphaerales bacterium]|nr:YraN family protein [Phycisphaerales bacterium]